MPPIAPIAGAVGALGRTRRRSSWPIVALAAPAGGTSAPAPVGGRARRRRLGTDRLDARCRPHGAELGPRRCFEDADPVPPRLPPADRCSRSCVRRRPCRSPTAPKGTRSPVGPERPQGDGPRRGSGRVRPGRSLARRLSTDPPFFELYVRRGGPARGSGSRSAHAAWRPPPASSSGPVGIRAEALSDPRRLCLRDERLLEALRLALEEASSGSTAPNASEPDRAGGLTRLRQASQQSTSWRCGSTSAWGRRSRSSRPEPGSRVGSAL